MRTAALVAGLSLFELIAMRSARGQEGSPTASPLRFEVTPFLGYRFGGHLDAEGTGESARVEDHGVFAIALGMSWDDQSQIGLFYSRQATTIRTDSGGLNTGLDVEYLHLDSTLNFENFYRVKPYLIGALGLTRLRVDTIGTNDATRFSLAAGGGLRFPVHRRIDLRLEARAYLTFMDTSSSAFCSGGQSGGTCVLRGAGSVFSQYELLVGAAFAF